MKEMLAKAFQDNAKPKHKQVGENTRGVVFYACPNTGSWMADWGWQLRYIGASPSASIMHLRRGKHLEVGAVPRLLSVWCPQSFSID